MRNRLRGRVGVAQLASLAVVGVALGLILGFMFMSVVDTVSHEALSRIRPTSSDKLRHVKDECSSFSTELDIQSRIGSFQAACQASSSASPSAYNSLLLLESAMHVAEASDAGTDEFSLQASDKDITIKSNPDTNDAFPLSGSTIHTLCTSNGSPYLNYQTRIM